MRRYLGWLAAAVAFALAAAAVGAIIDAWRGGAEETDDSTLDEQPESAQKEPQPAA